MSSKSNEDGLAAARSRLRPVHGLAVEDAASKETQDSTRVVGDSTAAVAETGTMTDDVDVVDKNAFETVPVSLDAFLRVLVDGLVDEAVRAHEAAEEKIEDKTPARTSLAASRTNPRVLSPAAFPRSTRQPSTPSPRTPRTPSGWPCADSSDYGDSPTTRASARGTTLLLRDRRLDDETSPIS